MEISGKGPGVGIEAYVTNVKDKGPVAPVEGAAPTSPVQEDKVELSPEAREIQEAKRQLDEIPDIETEKVEALQQQIESGTYEVQGDRVAVNMLSESLIDQLL
jgi:negative regulator of flagellin synthesis FlgM